MAPASARDDAAHHVIQPALDARVRAEFRELVSGCGAYPLPRTRLSLRGSDRVRWLNGMVTNNIRDLSPGNGVYAFLLNPQGQIQGDMYVYQEGESLRVECAPDLATKVLALFDHYIIMDDVEVTDDSGGTATIGLAGPGSPEVLARCGIADPPLQPLQVCHLPWLGAPVTVTRMDMPIAAYQVAVPPPLQAQALHALGNAGAGSAGNAAVEMFRIAQGIPIYGRDIREKDLPQETGQARALHFSKGCYVGQEIVERIRSRGAVHRQFTGFELRGPLPATGTRLQSGGKELGELTSIATVPRGEGEAAIALGYVRREAAAEGNELTAGDVTAVVRSLPFQDILRS